MRIESVRGVVHASVRFEFHLSLGWYDSAVGGSD